MLQTQNDDLAVEAKSSFLKGVRVAVCGGGGIASIELPRLIRELRRHGAQVRCIVSENALRFVGKDSLEWASGANVMVTPTGMADHICSEDVVVVMPATADLLAKLSLGLASDGITTYLLSATGKGVPLVICPTMHASLANAPISVEHRNKLSGLAALRLLLPRNEEGKEKSLCPQTLALEVCHWFHRRKYATAGIAEKRALITLGGTRARIDAVRCLTNLSTGRLGQRLAWELYGRGIQTTLLQASVSQETLVFQDQKTIVAEEFEEFFSSAQKLVATDYAAVCHLAALSDYVCAAPATEKISSTQNELHIDLTRAPKLLELPHLTQVPWKMACKLTTSDDAAGRRKAEDFFRQHNLNVLLWNSADTSFQKDTGNHQAVFFLAEDKPSDLNLIPTTTVCGKNAIAAFLAGEVLQAMCQQILLGREKEPAMGKTP